MAGKAGGNTTHEYPGTLAPPVPTATVDTVGPQPQPPPPPVLPVPTAPADTVGPPTTTPLPLPRVGDNTSHDRTPTPHSSGLVGEPLSAAELHACREVALQWKGGGRGGASVIVDCVAWERCQVCTRNAPLGYVVCPWCATPAADGEDTATSTQNDLHFSLAVLQKAARRHAEILQDMAKGKYKSDKARDLQRFQSFLATRGLTPPQATPMDVTAFLAALDARGGGRQVVHTEECREWGADLVCASAGGLQVCSCPHDRMAAGSLHTVLKRIKNGLSRMGSTAPWDSTRHHGNPCKSIHVNEYITRIREEQYNAGVTSHPAEAVSPQKLRKVLDSLLRELKTLRGKGMWREEYQARRDLAFVAATSATGARGQQLASTKANQCVRLPGGGGVVFNWRWGKTLRSGAQHLVGIKCAWEGNIQSPYCPVGFIDSFVLWCATTFGWDMSRGYLFPNLIGPVTARNPRGAVRGTEPMVAKDAGQRFVARLTRLGIHNGETLHGLRAGHAFQCLVDGMSLRELMARCLWKSPTMAHHYLQLYKVLALQGKLSQETVTDELRGAGLTWADYEGANVATITPVGSRYTAAWNAQGLGG